METAGCGRRGVTNQRPKWALQRSTVHGAIHIEWEIQTVQKVHNIDMMFMQEEVVVMHKNQVGK